MRGYRVCVIGYIEEAIEAARRIRKGERQLFCGTCGKWRWPEECDHPNRLSIKEFNAAAKHNP